MIIIQVPGPDAMVLDQAIIVSLRTVLTGYIRYATMRHYDLSEKGVPVVTEQKHRSVATGTPCIVASLLLLPVGPEACMARMGKAMMIERVVFFQPRTNARDHYSNGNGCEQRWAPWAALGLAPIVRRFGLEAYLIDARVDHPGWMEAVAALGPRDLLAVSVMTGHAIRDATCASELAQAAGVRVVWGGPHVTLFPFDTLAQAPVDAVIPGFGYLPLSALLLQLQETGWPRENGGGVYVRPEAMPLRRWNATLARGTAAEHLPPPDLHLIGNWEPYINPDVAIASRTVNAIGSEGCERRCTFCSEPQTSSSTWLRRDVNQIVSVVAELVERSGANGVKFHDPNFFHDMDRALTFAQAWAAEVGLPWAATIYPDDALAVSDATMQTLAATGLSRVLIGLESPDPDIVRLAGKQYDPARIPELARKLAQVGVRGMFTFIVGWPDADPGHYDRTIEAAFALRRVWDEHQAKIHFLEPWPGTPVFTLLFRRGFSPPRSLAEWADIDYYHAQHAAIHDPSRAAAIHSANRRLSPYVDA